MRNETINDGGCTVEIVEFNSLNEFYDYICNTPYNKAFKDAIKNSDDRGRASERFTETRDFEEASKLFKNGWSVMAGELVQKMKDIERTQAPVFKQRNIYSMAGYQPCIPRYLSNCPDSMVSKKNVPIKQKVITLDKVFSYLGNVKSSQIIDEAIKALLIIKKFEAQGYRVNLNLVCMQVKYEYKIITKIRVKSANEKLNVSKVAFPLVNPSMARRLHFRFREVWPTIPSSFCYTYGASCDADAIRKYVPKPEYLIPAFIRKDIETIKSLDDLNDL